MLFVTLLLGQPVHAAEQFSAKVIGVSDGDTLTVLSHGHLFKIRLSGIDCPEKKQAFGQQAKAFTVEHAMSREVKVISSGHDRYRRSIADVILPDGQNLNDLLLANGYAWWYQKFSHDQHRRELAEDARKSKLGLWSDPHASAPWDFRRDAKIERNASQ